MSASALQLAALATSIVPGIDVAQVFPYSSNAFGDYDSALLRTRDRQTLIIRHPVTDSAKADAKREVAALVTLTSGVRSRLPFEAPRLLGASRDPKLPAVLYTFIPGRTVEAMGVEPDGVLAQSIGRALAAIHSLPVSAAVDAERPVQTAAEVRDEVRALVARVAATNRLAVSVEKRWTSAIDDDALWRFQPTVIHGNITPGALIGSDAGISGVIGWLDVRVADPARDFHWMLSEPEHVVESMLSAYYDYRSTQVDRQLMRRAMLYGELELGRWLLHGVREGDPAIIADAEGMLDDLASSIAAEAKAPLVHETLPVLDLSGVEHLLDGRRARSGAGEDATPASPTVDQGSNATGVNPRLHDAFHDDAEDHDPAGARERGDGHDALDGGSSSVDIEVDDNEPSPARRD